MKRYAVAVTMLASTAWPGHAAQIAANDNMITLDGEIGPNDFDTFKIDASPLGGKVTVMLTSPGGNLIPAIQIGEMIRLRGWTTYVASDCYSACALIWLGGINRVMLPTARIGFHAASVNGQENGMGNALVGAYLNRIGLSYDAVAFATRSGPDDVSLLTPAEAKRVGIDAYVIDTTQPARPKPQVAVAAPPTASQNRVKADPRETVRNLIANFNIEIHATMAQPCLHHTHHADDLSGCAGMHSYRSDGLAGFQRCQNFLWHGIL